MIAAGKYKAVACGQVVLGTSKQKGTPFIEFYFRVTDGPSAGEEVRWSGYFSEKTQERTIESLQFCGWDGDDLSEFSDGALHGLDTTPVQIVVEHEEYEKDGEKKVAPRVAWVNRIGGFLQTESAMASDAAASFGERMRGLVAKVRERRPGGDGTDFNHGANVKATGTAGKPRF